MFVLNNRDNVTGFKIGQTEVNMEQIKRLWLHHRFIACKLKSVYNSKRTTLAASSASHGNLHIQQNVVIFVVGVL